MSLSERLKQRRAEVGLSVKEVAAACDVTPNAVYAWETGDTKGLKPPNLVYAAEALKTYEKWLAIGTGPKVRAIRTDELSEAESELFNDVRDLSTDEFIAMKTTISALADKNRRKKKRS